MHTLFENGIPEISELEYYIKDDIVRHGARMLDVEKKLSNALADAVSTLIRTGSTRGANKFPI